MGSLSHISFPATPEGKVVSKFLSFQHAKDFSKGNEIFTEDAVFNGLLYKIKGREELVKVFQDFLDNVSKSMRVEAVSQAGENQFMVLHFTELMGSNGEIPTCDLLTMKDGKICRVDNCFDIAKVSQEVADNARGASNN